MKNTLLALLFFAAGFWASRFYSSKGGEVSLPPSLESAPVKASVGEPPTSAQPKAPPMTATPTPGAPAGAPAISEEKKNLLETLTEEDIETWHKLRSDKIKEFLKSNPEYWHVGHEGEKNNLPGRLDLNVLQASLGKYDCKIAYEIRETKIKSTYDFTLDLVGAESISINTLRMVGGSSESKGSMSSEFSWEYLGSEGRDLNVVWYNSNGNEQRYVSNFAFRLRSGMSVGEHVSTRLMGLGPAFNWVEIGTVEITKVR